MTAVIENADVFTDEAEVPVAKAPAKAEKKGKSPAQALYAKAESILRTKYADEFEEILSGLYAEAGMVRSRRLSAEERAAKEAAEAEAKAAAKIKAMLDQHPNLRSLLDG